MRGILIVKKRRTITGVKGQHSNKQAGEEERRNAVRFRANQKKIAMAPETDGNGREDTGTIH
ncbi:MAG: hypothetical protein JNM19_08060 [Chitinophagaceae bacterium]|nr:hypothetical protein [Chitinophagaceae bacterium]